MTAALLLDVLIAAYLLALVLILATGGVDLGLVRFNRAAKPILILLIAVPLRLTLGEPSRLLCAARRALPRASAVWSSIIPRISPANVDVAFAMRVASAATLSVGFIANLLLNSSRERSFAMPFDNARFVETLAAWDSGWYFDIARRGYYFHSDSPSSIAFFPLYPMLMRMVAWPFGLTEKATWIAGIVISCTAFAVALHVAHRLSYQILGCRETARRTVLYIAVFPFALFFTRVYAESLLLLTSVLAIHSALNGRWWRAGLWGALATLARPNGVLIGVPLFLMAVQDMPALREASRRFAALFLIPAALAGYCMFVFLLSGDPFGWLSAQKQWGYSLGHAPWTQLIKMIDRIERLGLYDYFFVSPMAPFRLLHGTTALLFLALIPAVFKQLGIPLGAYVLVSLLIPLSGSALEGVGRYAAVLFPAFMVVGHFKSPRAHEAILIVASLFLALLVCLFVTNRPIY